MHLRVVENIRVHRKMTLADVCDSPIDIDNINILDVGVFHHLASGTAVTATDNEHSLERGTAMQRNIHHQFPVVLVVKFREHDHVVDEEEFSQVRMVVYFNELIL